MKVFMKFGGVCLTVISLWLPLQAVACNFPAGFFHRMEVNPGTIFVGRDAPIGTEITRWIFDEAGFGPPSGNGRYDCPTGSRIEAMTPLPQIHNSPLVPAGEVILQTRIPGIGLVVSAHMMGGGRTEFWNFVPAQGHRNFGVPYVATQTNSETARIGSVWLFYRLIKIGPTQPGMGPQSLAGHTLVEFTSSTHGKVLDIVIASGALDEAMCGLPAGPGKQITVPMGTWRTGQFRGEGSVTDTMSFNVALEACQAGTSYENRNFAHLRLDPRNGSSVLDAQRGILGLNSDSDATGVGVQVLKDDLTPMPLTEEVQMVRMRNGDIQIPMAARYIQVGKDTPVGGVANASVGFTLTYK